MSEINVILAPMAGRTVCTTKTVYQYNQGMILRLLGIDLPQAYTVDYANSVTGSSISQVGGADGVTIPDQFFVPGSTIHAWVVLTGADYVVTRYHIMIPISPRAVRTNEEPTPSQQSALDEAIAALNGAVGTATAAAEDARLHERMAADCATLAETAASHYPKVEGGYWMVWDVEAGAYVSTGVQAQGPQGIPGQDGADGADGQDGTDGISPTIATSEITGGHRLTITDAQGTSTVDVMDGADGQDGQDGAPGQDGQDGAPGVGVPSGGTAGQILRKSSGTDYDTEWTDKNPVVTISGTTAAITALPGVRYVCGEVATLDITLPASGCVDVVFESGSTATVLTITPPSGVTLKWANGFDPTALDANTTYELNIADGLGVAGQWT